MTQFSGIPFIDWLVWRVVHADVTSVVSGRDCTDHASIVDVVFIGYKAFSEVGFETLSDKRSNTKLTPFCSFQRRTSHRIPTLTTESWVE